MSEDNNSDYISVKSWMLLLLLPYIPVVGWILMLVLAFAGGNQTRKNYYRAMLAWIVLLIVGLFLLVFVFDAWPSVQQYIRDYQAKYHH